MMPASRIGCIMAVVVTSSFSVQAQTPADKCATQFLSKAVHERMIKSGRSEGEIREVLDSGFKRRVVRGRVVVESGCTEAQVNEAIDALKISLGKG
jgi:hypothetical protein